MAVEQAGGSLEDLKASAARHDLSVRAVRADVGRFDPSREAFDAVVLDPPRAGAPKVLPRLLRNRPRTVVYVSCHVPSCAADIQPALKAGYRVAQVQCFGLFPDTPHVETVVVLER